MAVFGREKWIGRTGKVVETEMVTLHMKRVRLEGPKRLVQAKPFWEVGRTGLD